MTENFPNKLSDFIIELVEKYNSLEGYDNLVIQDAEDDYTWMNGQWKKFGRSRFTIMLEEEANKTSQDISFYWTSHESEAELLDGICELSFMYGKGCL